MRTSGVSSTEVGRVTASTRLSLSDAVSPSAFASASDSYIAEKQKRKRSQALSRILGVDIQKDPSTFENPSPSTPKSHREQPLLCHKLWMLRTTKTAQALSGKAGCSGYCPCNRAPQSPWCYFQTSQEHPIRRPAPLSVKALWDH